MRELRIEWRHLESEGATCERCGDTGEAVKVVVQDFVEENRGTDVEVSFVETKLDPDRIAESNLILLNGVPLEKWLPGAVAGEDTCGSCSDLLQTQTCCRTVEVEGVVHEALSAEMIREAVRRALQTLRGEDR